VATDGFFQALLLVVVFCCPLIPAGGWCWLKCIEGCLNCLGFCVAKMRRFAYVPMYVCLLLLLAKGVYDVVGDYFSMDNHTVKQTNAFHWFVVTAVVTFLSIAICVASTMKVCYGQVSIEIQRERTVYIVALPGFFCLMCFLSCQTTLFQMLGTIGHHWDMDQDKLQDPAYLEKFTTDMGTFYFGAADVFESLAFTFFGMLTMEALTRAADLAESDEREVRLQSCIRKWTMSPIYMFCGVLIVQATYHVTVIFVKYFSVQNYLPPALYQFLKDQFQDGDGLDENVVKIVFFTLTSIFSSLAIMALFSIEHVFHEDLVRVNFVEEIPEKFKMFEFLSNTKFWGVKLFVTCEFSLQCLNFVVTMDVIQWNLIYSVAMAALCLVISVLHVWAYAPSGLWIAKSSNEGSFQARDLENHVLDISQWDDGPSRQTSSIGSLPTSFQGTSMVALSETLVSNISSDLPTLKLIDERPLPSDFSTGSATSGSMISRDRGEDDDN